MRGVVDTRFFAKVDKLMTLQQVIHKERNMEGRWRISEKGERSGKKVRFILKEDHLISRIFYENLDSLTVAMYWE